MVFKIQDTERKILEIVSQAAAKMQVPAYVVGGYVRDRLLARASKDIDIVCVGSGIELAQRVAGELHPVPRITVF